MQTFEELSPPHGGTADHWRSWAEGLPVSRAMGLQCLDIEPGSVRVVLHDAGWPLNPNGAVHGGMVVAWADHCCGLVAARTVQAGHVPATACLSAEFLRPSLPPLNFEARVDRAGRTLAFVDVRVFDSTGRLCAKVMATMSVDGTSRFVDATATT